MGAFFVECRKLDRNGYGEMYDWMREKLVGEVYSVGLQKPLDLNGPMLPGSLCVGEQPCPFAFVAEKDALEFALTWS